MRRLLCISVLIMVGLTSAFAGNIKEHRSSSVSGHNRQCVAISKAQVEALFDRWNHSLQTGDAQKVAANYAHDAVLLPTLSRRARFTDQERVDYFKGFLKKGPVGHIDSRTIRVGCNKAIDTGNYTFSFKDGSYASARYTFTYAWNGKAWLITSHHSSIMPNGK